MNSFKAYTIVAGVSSAGSLLIVLTILITLTHQGPYNISEGAMWAIAAMVAAPALMGIGVSYFISRTPFKETSDYDVRKSPFKEID